MTARFVIDASIAVAWVHPAQATRDTDRLLDEVARDARFAVPALWMLEVVNALLVLERRRKLRSDERAEALETLLALGPAVDEDGARSAFGRVSDLAVEHGLSVYDATYLELSLREKLPLVTKDVGLRAAARRAAVPLHP
ncbi:type II toxin-antitoxin system VapC family toxin [Candidatus Binatia bacterium]|nr:type II toxin-antitoxin system VapC family toxin [Candidatus Binatia bacterium]